MKEIIEGAREALRAGGERARLAAPAKELFDAHEARVESDANVKNATETKKARMSKQSPPLSEEDLDDMLRGAMQDLLIQKHTFRSKKTNAVYFRVPWDEDPEKKYMFGAAASMRQVRSDSHWSPYDRVRVVNPDP